MVEPSAAILVATFSVVLLAYCVFGLTGFGSAAVAVPLLVNLVPLRTALPLVVLFDVATGLVLCGRYRHTLAREELSRLLPWLFVGLVLGVAVVARASERILLPLLGAFVCASALFNLVGRVPSDLASRLWAFPAGLAGGVVTAVFGGGGPIYVMYLARRIDNTQTLRSTISAIVLITSVGRLCLFGIVGMYADPTFWLLAAATAPAVPVGYWLGTALHHRLQPAQVSRAIWLLVGFCGLLLLVRGLSR